jgi:serine/threonine-protein kinase
MTGDVIAGRYRLVEPLGRGSMSSVWLAEDTELARKVAIKLLAPTADRARFEREARAVAALSHPNISQLYDYGESDGKPYMALEYLPGGTLEDRLAPGRPLPDAETHRIASEVAAGLAHAHGRGLVHRDLKPANILFDSEGRAKIADFGIARMGGGGTLTEAGTVLGTAAYISPEQAAGLPATAASDVYSFGVQLFRMLTGRLPFVAANAMELVRMNRDDPPPAVFDVRPDAPALLAATADASLAKDPARRPADGAALVAALRDAPTAATMLAAGETQVLAPVRQRRRIPLLVPLLVLALVLLLGGVALALALSSGGGSDAPAASSSHLSVPNVSTVGSTTVPLTTATTAHTTTTTAPTTTAPTTTAPTTTRETTTAHTTTARTTTARTTTAHTTTSAPPPTTTFDTTTIDTTTVPVTTDTTSTGTTSSLQSTTTATP